jgi:DNA-binding transcriptional LysR family regulator
MTLEQLRIFVTVAQLQHVTQAAAKLNLTQSSASAAIAALEARHDLKLFNRVGRRIELTREGAIFFQSASAVLAEAANAELTLADLGGLRRGSVAVFASQTIANFWLPPRLVRYHQLHSGVTLDIRIGNTAESVAAVVEGTAEIGLIEGEYSQPLLSTELLDQDRLQLVVGANHPWAKSPPRLPDDIATTEWAVREPGSGTRSTLEQALALKGYRFSELPIALELPSNEALCVAVGAGTMATAVSALVGRSGIEAGDLVPIAFDLGTRKFRLVSHSSRPLSRAATALAALLRCPAAAT